MAPNRHSLVLMTYIDTGSVYRLISGFGMWAVSFCLAIWSTFMCLFAQLR